MVYQHRAGQQCACDPVTRSLPVLLLPDYDAESDRRYFVLYYLIGFTGRGTMMLNEERWQPTLLQRLDRLYTDRPKQLLRLSDWAYRFTLAGPLAE